MKPEWIAVAGMLVTLGGFVWHAARAAERLDGMRRDFEKFERDVGRELETMRNLLLTNVGGRRRYRPTGHADDIGPGST